MIGIIASRGFFAASWAFLLLGLPQVAEAQNSMWEFNAHAGALRNNVASERTGPIVGGSVARYTAGGLGIGGSVDWSRGEHLFPDDARADFDQVFYGLDVDYSFPQATRTRFALGSGVGAAWSSVQAFSTEGDPIDATQTNLTVPISGGVKILNRAIRPSWALRFDVRDRMVFLGDEDIFLTSESGVKHNVQATAGLSFFVGGPKRYAEKPVAQTMEPQPSNPGLTAPSRDAGREAAVATIEERIFFDFDRFDIRSSDREVLERKAEALRVYPEMRVAIEGHADERGTVEYNLALGERRAEAARRYLADLGIDPNRMDVVSFGEERPAVAESNEAAWAQNRRDEFVVKPR